LDELCHTLKTSLDPTSVLSAAFFRTHLGHRENATELAIGLIQKGVASERASLGGDPFEIECADNAERWAIDHIIQGCYMEEYHHWEKAIKQYFKRQRELNGLPDDFDWRLRNKTLVERAIDVLNFFGTTVDQEVTNAIDTVREKVNWLKHDPLSCHIEKSDYDTAIKALEQFWDFLIETESKQFA
jgi:hypothetical protein